MKRTLISTATLAALTALSAVPGHALAQDAAADTPPAPSTDIAQADDAELPTVYVVSEKSGRSLLDTATSAVVLEQADLEQRAGLNTARDVLANTPNIVVLGPGNTAPAVRGVDGTGAAQGVDAFVAGSRPRLNMQIDGRPASYNEIVFGDGALWDVQQVEVLRGAQSTLQGRNAIAGTIAVKTNDPGFQPEGALRVAAGNYGQRRASGMLSGPLSESVAYRLAADWLTRDGWVDGVKSTPGGGDPTVFEALNLRGKLLLEPNSIEGLRSLLTVNHADYSGPQTELVSRPFDDRVIRESYVEPVFQPRSSSLIADSRYQIDPALAFESLLSATDLNVKRKTDPGSGIANIDGREYVVEPRLRYGGGGRASGVAGLYLFKADQDEALDTAGGLAFDDSIQTAALFGEATWPLSATLDLIAGARYEREHHERSGGGGGGLVQVSLDETYTAFLPKLGIAWHPRPLGTLGFQVLRGYNGGGAGAAFDEALSAITNYQYDPEYVWTYELFVRQELADRRLRLSANLFRSDYKDMQLLYDLTPQDTTDYSSIVRNADRARTYGAEFSATWLPARGLELYANLGLLQAEITRYPGSGFQGHELPLAPPVSVSLGISWERGSWDANLGGRYAGSYFSELDNEPRSKVDPYTVLNAQAGYRWGQVRVYASVTNLLDADDPTAIYPGSAPLDDAGNPVGADPDYDAANLLAPRMGWLGIQFNW